MTICQERQRQRLTPAHAAQRPVPAANPPAPAQQMPNAQPTPNRPTPLHLYLPLYDPASSRFPPVYNLRSEPACWYMLWLTDWLNSWLTS